MRTAIILWIILGFISWAVSLWILTLNRATGFTCFFVGIAIFGSGVFFWRLNERIEILERARGDGNAAGSPATPSPITNPTTTDN